MTFNGLYSLFILLFFIFSAYLLEKLTDALNKRRKRHENNATKLAKLFMRDQK